MINTPKINTGLIPKECYQPFLAKFSFCDKGYISKALSDLLFADGIQLITKVKKNMKHQSLSATDKILLRKSHQASLHQWFSVQYNECAGCLFFLPKKALSQYPDGIF